MRWALLVVVLTGCLQRYQPLRDAGRLERQGDPAEAEAAWERVLKHKLAQVEFATAHRHLCKLRAQRLAAETAELQLGDVTREQVRSWRQVLAACGTRGELGALQVRLAWLEEGLALQALDDLEESPRFHHVYEAFPQVRTLSEGRPERATFDGWRAEWLAHLQRLDVGGPVTAAWIDQLEVEAGGEVVPDAGAADLALAFHDGAIEVTTDASCAPYLSPKRREATGGAGYPVDATHRLEGCGTREEQVMVDIPYPVTRYRTEMQRRPVTTYRTESYPVTTTTGARRCYQTSRTHQTCFQDTSTTYRTRSVPVVTYVDEQVQVPYTVTEYRKENRFRRTNTATLHVITHTPHGSAAWRMPVSGTHLSVTPTNAGTGFGSAYDEARGSAMEASRAAARAAHLQDLLGRSDLATLAGVEARLTAVAAGRPLTDPERAAIAETLGLPPAALADVRPDLTRPTPDPLPPDPASQPAPLADDDSVLRFGFPRMMASIGLGPQAGTDTLAGHPRSTSFGASARYDLNLPLTVGTPVGDFGLHAGAHGALHYGRATQPRYVFRTTAFGREENDREPRATVAFDGSVGLMAGYRNAWFATFAGVAPRGFFQRNGFVRSAATSLPLTARLELRLVPRRPILLTVWGYAVDRDDPLDTYGAKVALPLSDELWFGAEYSVDAGRTQLPGLHDQDWLDAGQQPFTRTWVGFSAGF